MSLDIQFDTDLLLQSVIGAPADPVPAAAPSPAPPSSGAAAPSSAAVSAAPPAKQPRDASAAASAAFSLLASEPPLSDARLRLFAGLANLDAAGAADDAMAAMEPRYAPREQFAAQGAGAGEAIVEGKAPLGDLTAEQLAFTAPITVKYSMDAAASKVSTGNILRNLKTVAESFADLVRRGEPIAFQNYSASYVQASLQVLSSATSERPLPQEYLELMNHRGAADAKPVPVLARFAPVLPEGDCGDPLVDPWFPVIDVPAASAAAYVRSQDFVADVARKLVGRTAAGRPRHFLQWILAGVGHVENTVRTLPDGSSKSGTRWISLFNYGDCARLYSRAQEPSVEQTLQSARLLPQISSVVLREGRTAESEGQYTIFVVDTSLVRAVMNYCKIAIKVDRIALQRAVGGAAPDQGLRMLTEGHAQDCVLGLLCNRLGGGRRALPAAPLSDAHLRDGLPYTGPAFRNMLRHYDPVLAETPNYMRMMQPVTCSDAIAMAVSDRVRWGDTPTGRLLRQFAGAKLPACSESGLERLARVCASVFGADRWRAAVEDAEAAEPPAPRAAPRESKEQKEQKEREAREKKEQKERELREKKEQKEREAREQKEQKERDAREQKEKKQREKEQKEREQKEAKEQREREKKEQKEREKELREQKAREKAAKSGADTADEAPRKPAPARKRPGSAAAQSSSEQQPAKRARRESSDSDDEDSVSDSDDDDDGPADDGSDDEEADAHPRGRLSDEALFLAQQAASMISGHDATDVSMEPQAARAGAHAVRAGAPARVVLEQLMAERDALMTKQMRVQAMNASLFADLAEWGQRLKTLLEDAGANGL